MRELKGRALLHRTGSLAVFAETTVKICGCGVGTEEAKTTFIVREVSLRTSLSDGRSTTIETTEKLIEVGTAALAVEVYAAKGGKLA